MLASQLGKLPTVLTHRNYTWIVVSLLVIVSLCAIPEVALAQMNVQQAEICLAIADERDLPGGGEDHEDTLTQIDRNTAAASIIGLTGTQNIEAMTFGPMLNLYAENNGFLGIVNLATGVFSPFSQPIGTGDGEFGAVSLRDVDGLAYSLDRGIIFASRRRSGAPLDLLFAINPATGQFIPGYFTQNGSAVDYVAVQAVLDEAGSSLRDVDDMQFDPVSGILYAGMNSDGSRGSLVTIDVDTGQTSVVATFTFTESTEVINDIEGLSFFNDGTMYASTGDNFDGAPEDRNKLFKIIPTTGKGTFVGAFPTGPKDYEALACLTAQAAIVLKKYTNGPGQSPVDADSITGPLIQQGDAVTWTYIFTNTSVLTLTNLSLVDDILGPIVPSATNNCFTSTTLLGPGDSLTCTATGVAASGQYTNVGTVTGTTAPGLPQATVSDSDPSHYFGVAPAIEIKKYTNGEDADTPTGPIVMVGSAITWTYHVSNTGNVPLSNVVVTDDKLAVPPAFVSGDTNGDTLLDLGEIWIFQATGTAVEGQYANTGTVTGTPPIGPNVSDNDPSHYFASLTPLGALGDRVWYDNNRNGIQDAGEPGVPGIQVDLYNTGGTLLKTTTTNASGDYLFTNLLAGDYVVQFATPAGHSFTLHNVNGNSQDPTDSDPLVPTVALSISDGGKIAPTGEVLTYTLSYTNSDPALAAVGVVLSTTVPAGTTFNAAASTPGWSCTSNTASGICTLNVGTVNANANGSAAFAVLLDEDDANVPGELILLVGVIQATPGRTATVTLDAGETDLTVDAGLVRVEASLQTETSTSPTSLPGTDQPQDGLFIFLPSVQTEE